ncbi:MAG: hypothetical protein K2N47_03095, partial [Clostridia bacterium]|nr:hypothetical protein [Clostridia bacterium]
PVFHEPKHFSITTLYWNIVEILIGLTLIIFVSHEESPYPVVCVAWATWSILRETRELVEITEEFKERPTILGKVVSILSVLESLTVIAFSITMIIEPGEHHAMIHMYLLAVELATKVLFPIFYMEFKRKKAVAAPAPIADETAQGEEETPELAEEISAERTEDDEVAVSDEQATDESAEEKSL